MAVSIKNQMEKLRRNILDLKESENLSEVNAPIIFPDKYIDKLKHFANTNKLDWKVKGDINLLHKFYQCIVFYFISFIDGCLVIYKGNDFSTEFDTSSFWDAALNNPDDRPMFFAKIH